MSLASPILQPVTTSHEGAVDRLEVLPEGKRRVVRRWRVVKEGLRNEQIEEKVFQKWGAADGAYAGDDGRKPNAWVVVPDAFLVEQRVLPESEERPDARIVEKVYEQTPYIVRDSGEVTRGSVTYRDVTIVTYAGQELPKFEGWAVVNPGFTDEAGRRTWTVRLAKGWGVAHIRRTSDAWQSESGSPVAGLGGAPARMTTHVTFIGQPGDTPPRTIAGVVGVLVADDDGRDEEGWRVWELRFELWDGTLSVNRRADGETDGVWYRWVTKAWPRLPSEAELNAFYETGEWSLDNKDGGWVTTGKKKAEVDESKLVPYRRERGNSDHSMSEDVRVIVQRDEHAPPVVIGDWENLPWPKASIDEGLDPVIPVARGVLFRSDGLMVLDISFLRLPMDVVVPCYEPWLKPGRVIVDGSPNVYVKTHPPTQIQVLGSWRTYYTKDPRAIEPWSPKQWAELSFSYRELLIDSSTGEESDGSWYRETNAYPGYLGQRDVAGINKGSFGNVPCTSLVVNLSSVPAELPSVLNKVLYSPPPEPYALDVSTLDCWYRVRYFTCNQSVAW